MNDLRKKYYDNLELVFLIYTVVIVMFVLHRKYGYYGTDFFQYYNLISYTIAFIPIIVGIFVYVKRDDNAVETKSYAFIFALAYVLSYLFFIFMDYLFYRENFEIGTYLKNNQLYFIIVGLSIIILLAYQKNIVKTLVKDIRSQLDIHALSFVALNTLLVFSMSFENIFNDLSDRFLEVSIYLYLSTGLLFVMAIMLLLFNLLTKYDHYTKNIVNITGFGFIIIVTTWANIYGTYKFYKLLDMPSFYEINYIAYIRNMRSLFEVTLLLVLLIAKLLFFVKKEEALNLEIDDY